MSDRIIISRLAIFGHHGLFAEEARLGQRFLISASCETDLGAAGAADDIKQTTSYASVADIIVAIATKRRFRLLEGLAEAIATGLLDAFPRFVAATVRVEKPGAPIPHMFEMVAVEIERRRHV